MPKIFDVWTTKDGREIPVVEMTDLHLLQTVRAIDDGRVLGDSSERENWLMVLKAEAIQRGLDWTVSPTRRLGLLDAVIDQLFKSGKLTSLVAEELKGNLALVMGRLGLSEQPEIDAENKTGRASYLHWTVGVGWGLRLSRRRYSTSETRSGFTRTLLSLRCSAGSSISVVWAGYK